MTCCEFITLFLSLKKVMYGCSINPPSRKMSYTWPEGCLDRCKQTRRLQDDCNPWIQFPCLRGECDNNCLHHWVHSFLLSSLVDQTLVNMWNDTSSSNCSLDQCIQLLISSDGELQMPWCNSLHLQILGGVTSQLKNLCT